MRIHKKLFALAVMLVTIGFGVGIGLADLLVDRGLPTANLNDEFGNASNTSFGFQSPLIVGDTFSIGTAGQSYHLNTISVWVVGEPSVPTALFGGYTATTGGVGQISSTVLHDTVVTYTGGVQYYGGTYDIHQVDFQVDLTLNGGQDYYFFVNGAPDVDNYTPFMHATNALLSGTTQDGSDNLFYVYDTSTGDIYLENAATGLWDKGADINVDVDGNLQVVPTIDTPTSGSIANTSATLGATIEADGYSPITAAGVAYGLTANPDTTGSKVASSATTGAFTVDVTGLTPNTVYHFRGYATNAVGTGYTSDTTFTTVANVPTANYATGVTSTSFNANWTAPSGTAVISGYRLDVATDSGFTAMVTGYSDLLVSGTTKAVTGLPAGGTYYYRVRAVNGGGTGGNSNTITVVLSVPSAITITSPNGGEGWKAGSKQAIRWTYSGTPGARLTIELLKSGSVTATIASNVLASKGSYVWTLKPTMANGADYQVRITSTKNYADTATSQSFTIIGSTITVTSPNGGEVWKTGGRGLITWTYTGTPGPVKIELLKAGVAFSNIKLAYAAGVRGHGSFRWSIPKNQATGTDYTVRITSKSSPSCTDTSDANFGIGSVLAAAGPDQKAKASAVVSLSGRNSTGVDENSASYKWTQTDGPSVELSDSNAAETVFVAPEDADGKSLGFQLTVTDSEGVQSEDSCIVNVSENSAAPIAEAGANQVVAVAQIVELDGSGSSASSSIVSYSWRQVSGVPVMLSDASAMQTTFVAPDVDAAGEAVVFELTVTDQAGLRSRDTCIVNVIANDKPPIAQAGANGTAFAGSAVLLDGSGSTDPDNGIASYRWRQVSGKPAVLSDPTGVKTTFIAPEIDSATEALVFELTVTDAAGLQDKSKVVITVSSAGGSK